MSLFIRPSMSWPMQNASVTFTAASEAFDYDSVPKTMKDLPRPRIPAIKTAETIAHGTAVAAFEDSSEICTLESSEAI
jgi:phospholipase C